MALQLLEYGGVSSWETWLLNENYCELPFFEGCGEITYKSIANHSKAPGGLSGQIWQVIGNKIG